MEYGCETCNYVECECMECFYCGDAFTSRGAFGANTAECACGDSHDSCDKCEAVYTDYRGIAHTRWIEED